MAVVNAQYEHGFLAAIEKCYRGRFLVVLLSSVFTLLSLEWDS